MAYFVAKTPLPVDPTVNFRELLDRLGRSPTQLIADLGNAPWSSISKGVAGELWWELITVTQTAKDATPWLAVRHLSIRIHDEHGERWPALTLILGLLAVPGRGLSSEVFNLLANDRAWLEQELGIAEVTKARRVKAKVAIVARLITLANDPLTITNLRNLRQRLVRERRKNLLGRAIFVWIIACNSLGIASTTSTPPAPPTFPAVSYNASVPPPLPLGPALPSVSATPPPPQPASTRPAALGLNLEMPELRWCIYQSVRIDAAHIAAHDPNATSTTLAEFNRITNDWNAVCSRYQYRESDGAQVIREVAVWHDALEGEGRSMLATASSQTAIGAPAAPPLISPPS